MIVATCLNSLKRSLWLNPLDNPEEENMLKSVFKYSPNLALVGMLLVLWQCASSSPIEQPPAMQPEAPRVSSYAEQTFEQQYAGEILGYMMQVVLGKAGDPKIRDLWYTRAADMELDYETVSGIMTESTLDKKRLLVLDNNILGLSKVLYHYNERLNLFKGENHRESPFPSIELLAMRMLLLQKIHRDEKVTMENLIRQRDRLTDPTIDAADMDPTVTGLNTGEVRLLKSIIAAEPFFMDYLENPFVVDTLYRVGVVDMDAFVRKKISEASYRDFNCPPDRSARDPQSVTIAIMPSITRAFEYRGVDRNEHPCGFKPNEAYLQASQEIQNKILTTTRQLVAAQAPESKIKTAATTADDAGVMKFVDDHVTFVDFSRRPLVIYPENADKVIGSLCPEADFTILILGENVYLSFHLSEIDMYPNVNRLYLDILDVRHAQVDYELSQVSMFIFNRLKHINPQPM